MFDHSSVFSVFCFCLLSLYISTLLKPRDIIRPIFASICSKFKKVCVYDLIRNDITHHILNFLQVLFKMTSQEKVGRKWLGRLTLLALVDHCSNQVIVAFNHLSQTTGADGDYSVDMDSWVEC